jgi:hypothetical protein
MENIHQKDHSRASSAIYQIKVKGKLDAHWAEWFNGTTLSMAYDLENPPKTIMTLQLRDQSELLGILNRLQDFNLLILQVILTGNEGENYGGNG